MTDIELVNFVFDKLIAQGGCSTGENGDCLYRSNDGRKCAAGHLIPDEDFKPEFEGKSCTPLPWQEQSNKLISQKISDVLLKHGYNPKAVYKLQSIHDNGTSCDNQINYFEIKRQYLIQELESGLKLEDVVL